MQLIPWNRTKGKEDGGVTRHMVAVHVVRINANIFRDKSAFLTNEPL